MRESILPNSKSLLAIVLAGPCLPFVRILQGKNRSESRRTPDDFPKTPPIASPPVVFVKLPRTFVLERHRTKGLRCVRDHGQRHPRAGS